jgi:hypothetical protein
MVVTAINTAQTKGKIGRIDKRRTSNCRGASGKLCDDSEQILTCRVALSDLDIRKDAL